MPFLFFLLTNFAHGGCPGLVDRVRVKVLPQATMRAQELLGLNLLSAPDRLRLFVRRDGANLRIGLDRGRALFDVTLDDEGRATLSDDGERIDVVVSEGADGVKVSLEVPFAWRARFERGPAQGLDPRYRVPVLSGGLE